MIRILLAILFLSCVFTGGNAQNSSFAASANLPDAGIAGAMESVNPLEVKVYPNPVDNNFVTVELPYQNIHEIRITNIAGSAVYLRKFQGHVTRYRVILENVPNGIYLLRVTSENNLTKTIKLLVRTQ